MQKQRKINRKTSYSEFHASSRRFDAKNKAQKDSLYYEMFFVRSKMQSRHIFGARTYNIPRNPHIFGAKKLRTGVQ